MKDFDSYRKCPGCHNRVLVGFPHDCGHPEAQTLSRRERRDIIEGALMILAALGLAFYFIISFATSARAQSLEQNVYRAISNAQVLAVDITPRSITAPFFRTGLARLVCTISCYFHVAKTPMASTTTGSFLPANTPTNWAVREGETVEVVLHSGSGTVIIQELAK